MAAIDLRNCLLYFLDGTDGSAVVETASPTANDVTVNVNTVSIPNASTNTLVPVGARFTVNTANNVTTYTVTGRSPASEGPTECVTFTPALGNVGTPATGDAITFLPQRVEIKVGEGNLSWTETKEYEYIRDRGDLDTVKLGDEQPLEISLDFMFEHVTAGTGEDITVVDALKNTGNASEWITSSEDACEPYSVDLMVVQCNDCGTTEDDKFNFPDFRWESLEYNVSDATIASSGKCNASSATYGRGSYDECS